MAFYLYNLNFLNEKFRYKIIKRLNARKIYLGYGHVAL
jgi:hypothetical protein